MLQFPTNKFLSRHLLCDDNQHDLEKVRGLWRTLSVVAHMGDSMVVSTPWWSGGGLWVSSELKVDAKGFSALSERSSTSAAELGLSDGRYDETLVQYFHCDCASSLMMATLCSAVLRDICLPRGSAKSTLKGTSWDAWVVVDTTWTALLFQRGVLLFFVWRVVDDGAYCPDLSR